MGVQLEPRVAGARQPRTLQLRRVSLLPQSCLALAAAQSQCWQARAMEPAAVDGCC